MMDNKEYFDWNKKGWNNKTDIHIDSEFYDNESFIAGKSSLKNIELSLFGDIRGKKILHLQCHFGQDSISLARMGAKVTACDLSPNAIEKANQLAVQTGLYVEFICCNVYDLQKYLEGQFDIVFTSYGVISWLPDLDKWAKVISSFLKLNGLFVFAEFHPIVSMLDDDYKVIEYSYFNTEPIIYTQLGTYADTGADLLDTMVNWNHSIADIQMSLIRNGIEIQHFEEYDYSPFNCFSNMRKIGEDKYIFPHFDQKLPLVFSLRGFKKN